MLPNGSIQVGNILPIFMSSNLSPFGNGLVLDRVLEEGALLYLIGCEAQKNKTVSNI